MNRVLSIHIDELIADAAAMADMVHSACHHQHAMRVSGLIQVGEHLLIALESVEKAPAGEFVFAPFDSINAEELAVDIHKRYCSGFSLLGGFDSGKDYWGLFLCTEPRNDRISTED